MNSGFRIGGGDHQPYHECSRCFRGRGSITLRVVGEQVSLSSPNSGLEFLPHIVTSGLYARVSVSDTGHGMTPEVLAQATEAFFTTKKAGRGRGLGLAGVRSFTERAGGHVVLESEVGSARR